MRRRRRRLAGAGQRPHLSTATARHAPSPASTARCFAASSSPSRCGSRPSPPRSPGVDEVVGQHLSWGLGLRVDPDGFSMGGLGGSLGAASRLGRYGMGFLPASMGDHDRANRLERALRQCLGLPPLE